MTIIGGHYPKKSRWASPKGNIAVGKDISGAFNREIGSGDGEHVGVVALAVHDANDEGFAAENDRQRSAVVYAYCHTEAIGQGLRVERPAHRVAGGLATLTLKAAAAEPPVQALIPIHQKNRSRMTRDRLETRWLEEEAVCECVARGCTSTGK